MMTFFNTTSLQKCDFERIQRHRGKCQVSLQLLTFFIPFLPNRFPDRSRRSTRLSCLAGLRGGDGDSGGEKSPSINGPCIGIDLGTTYSCVGVWRNGRVEICANEQGHRITPSYVSWMKPEGTRLIGDSAKNAAASNPTNTVFDVKRLIGRKFDDPSVQKDKALFPFELVKDKEGKPNVQVEIKGEKKEMSPEEVSGMVSV